MPIVTKAYGDRSNHKSALIKHLDQLQAEIANVFPGSFYQDSTDGVVQVKLTPASYVGGSDRVEAIIPKCADYPKAVEFMDRTDVQDWLGTVATPEWQLVDLAKSRVLGTQHFVYQVARNDGKYTLYRCEETGEYFSFEIPTWIITTCNHTSRYSMPSVATAFGKYLLGVVINEYTCLNQVKSVSDLLYITNIALPVGGYKKTPEERFGTESLTSLTSLSERLLRKRPSKKGITISMLQILSQLGIPAPMQKYSKEHPNVIMTIIIDTLQEHLASAYMLDGVVHVELVVADSKFDACACNLFDVAQVAITVKGE